jgi:hypothetical protein
MCPRRRTANAEAITNIPATKEPRSLMITHEFQHLTALQYVRKEIQQTMGTTVAARGRWVADLVPTSCSCSVLEFGWSPQIWMPRPRALRGSPLAELLACGPAWPLTGVMLLMLHKCPEKVAIECFVFRSSLLVAAGYFIHQPLVAGQMLLYSLSLSPFLSLSLSLSLSFSLSICFSLYLFLTIYFSLSLSLSLSFFISIFSLCPCLSLSLFISLSLSLSLSYSFTPFLSPSPAISMFPLLTLSVSLSIFSPLPSLSPSLFESFLSSLAVPIFIALSLSPSNTLSFFFPSLFFPSLYISFSLCVPPPLPFSLSPLLFHKHSLFLSFSLTLGLSLRLSSRVNLINNHVHVTRNISTLSATHIEMLE